MKSWYIALVVVLLLGQVRLAKAAVVYSNDFEGSVGPEWSHTGTDVTPIGARRFLGQFTNDAVTLNLSGLSSHGQLTVAFDLFIGQSWDGNYVHPDWGPDHWQLEVAGGPTLLDTTFSNAHPWTARAGQAYPDAYGTGTHAPGTGAAEVDSLGYLFYHYGNPIPMDSVYHISRSFSHTGNSLSLEFSAWNLQGYNADARGWDEFWGLDNVVVSTDTSNVIPEAGSLAIWLLLGSLGLAVSCRRRGKLRQHTHVPCAAT